MRFIISKNLLPADRKAGFVAEVVDSSHPSDGGPVAILLCRTVAEASQAAAALNLQVRS